MDLLSTLLRTGLHAGLRARTVIRPLTQPVRLASWQVGAVQFCAEGGFQGLEATQF